MKAVLLSIKPKYCELIASGKKTIEVRKSEPKLRTPFKCYIYCTKDFYRKGNGYFQGRSCGKVIGEFICDKIYDCDADSEGLFDKETKKHLPESCLDWKTIFLYTKGTLPLYGWQISDLIIYDKPKELSEFTSCHINNDCKNCLQHSPLFHSKGRCLNYVKRPPQSWCYVEEL